MHLYLMKTPALPLRTKIGITKHHPTQRANNIACSMEVDVVVVFFVELWFAPMWEKVLHGLFFLFRTTAWGNGKTEWFWCVRWVSVILFCFLWLLEYGVALFLVASTIFLVLKSVL